MTDQLTLIEIAPVEPEPKPIVLTARQQAVLDALRAAGHDGLDADQAGALWHHAKGYHGPDDRCKHCGQTGKGILESLKTKESAYYRRANRVRGIPGVWLATDLAANPEVDSEAARGDFGEFPEGF